MNQVCASIAPSPERLSSWQKLGLDLVGNTPGQGRDIVLAVDLTSSVGFNDEGRIRIRQIVQNSLRNNDTVYIVPFAAQVNPLQVNVNPITPELGIRINSKNDLDKILLAFPDKPDLRLNNTDIQNAELYIYRALAALNQCRLTANQPVKAQAVIWLTDAPLNTNPGIPSSVWIETPADSPFRKANSPESLERDKWLHSLPLVSHVKPINNYALTVVDIKPTVQEFCTPIPGEQRDCIVTPYLINHLSLPVILLVIVLGIGATGITWLIRYLLSLQKVWRVKADGRIFLLANKDRLWIGGKDIDCPGDETRAYLKRKGNELFLEKAAHTDLSILYKGKELKQPIKITNNYIALDCPYQGKDTEINIKIEK